MLRPLEGSDASVQGTNDDAQVSKLSCSKAGYFRDEFIQYFVRRASRRSPLINRGYYSRHAALRQLLQGFLSAAEASGQQPQVLVLGAGFDTTWFQLSRDKGRVPYKCLEVDFKEVTQRKAAIIAKEAALHSILHQSAPQQPPQGQAAASASTAGPEPAAAATAAASSSPAGPQPQGSAAGATAGSAGPAGPSGPAVSHSGGQGVASSASGVSAPAGAAEAPGPPSAADVVVDSAGGRVLSPSYSLLPVDLRDLGALDAAVRQAGLDVRAPTYVLSECVLVYMEPQDSAAVVRWAAHTFTNAVMAIYEQIRPDDAFGRQMVSNLEMRGCPLKGLPATPTLDAHRARLLDAGWAWADARDMDVLYRSFVDSDDRRRIERLELFDELEEWHMIQEHYCIALGRNDSDGWLSNFAGFGAPQPQPPLSRSPPPPPPF